MAIGRNERHEGCRGGPGWELDGLGLCEGRGMSGKALVIRAVVFWQLATSPRGLW